MTGSAPQGIGVGPARQLPAVVVVAPTHQTPNGHVAFSREVEGPSFRGLPGMLAVVKPPAHPPPQASSKAIPLQLSGPPTSPPPPPAHPRGAAPRAGGPQPRKFHAAPAAGRPWLQPSGHQPTAGVLSPDAVRAYDFLFDRQQVLVPRADEPVAVVTALWPLDGEDESATGAHLGHNTGSFPPESQGDRPSPWRCCTLIPGCWCIELPSASLKS
jgi:hypothetical protein